MTNSTITQSPLLEAQADSLNTIFTEDPLELSEEQFDQLLEAVRGFRGQTEEKRAERSVKAQLMKDLEIGDDLLDKLVGGL